MTNENKDYSTISPSAGWLVNLKARTSIPFAKEAAAILFPPSPDAAPPKFTEEDRISIFKWMIHFENRYQTVEKLLEETNPQNILEISSGYSFRGIDWCLRRPAHFIDTDLPDLINIKTNITNQLIDDNEQPLKGKLEVLPLNAMQRDNFINVVSAFSPGPIAIVNEGLLVYLDNEEKKILCATIHDILKQRGGHWVTGDIYIKSPEDISSPGIKTITGDFRKQHRIDENRFDSYEAAEQFFTSCGFKVDKKISFLPERLSTLNLLGDRKEDTLKKIQEASSIRETWQLSV
jgi:O-methyltransferase involved in polyketide biosynthesis